MAGPPNRSLQDALFVYETSYGINKDHPRIEDAEEYRSHIPKIVSLWMEKPRHEVRVPGFVLFSQSYFFAELLLGMKVDHLKMNVSNLNLLAVNTIVQCLMNGILEINPPTAYQVYQVLTVARAFELFEIVDITQNLLNTLKGSLNPSLRLSDLVNIVVDNLDYSPSAPPLESPVDPRTYAPSAPPPSQDLLFRISKMYLVSNEGPNQEAIQWNESDEQQEPEPELQFFMEL